MSAGDVPLLRDLYLLSRELHWWLLRRHSEELGGWPATARALHDALLLGDDWVGAGWQPCVATTERTMSERPSISLDALQETVGQWAEATFPLASDTSICIHLGREVAELRAWAAASDQWGGHANLSIEAANCLLLLLHLAYRNGFSLVEAAQTKFGVNQSRLWGVVDAEGVVEHIEGAVQP